MSSNIIFTNKNKHLKFNHNKWNEIKISQKRCFKFILKVSYNWLNHWLYESIESGKQKTNFLINAEVYFNNKKIT